MSLNWNSIIQNGYESNLKNDLKNGGAYNTELMSEIKRYAQSGIINTLDKR